MRDVDSYHDIFAARGKQYHRAMREWPEARREELELLPQWLNLGDGEVLVDAPAGGGYLARHLSPGVRYIAVDPVEEFYRCCPGDEGRDRFHCSLDAISLPDDTVDAVVSLAGLHHEADPAAIFAEFFRVLRPGGRLGLAEVAADSAPARFLNGFVDAHSSLGHDGHFFDERVIGLLETVGLVDVSLDSVPLEWRFADLAGMATFARALFGMDRAGNEQIIDGVERILGTRTLSDGGVAMHWELLVVTASKPDPLIGRMA